MPCRPLVSGRRACASLIATRMSRPALRLRAGLGKTGFSREELTPVSDLLFAERGVTNDKFGDLGYLGRDIGLAGAGDLLGRPPLTTYRAFARSVVHLNDRRFGRLMQGVILVIWLPGSDLEPFGWLREELVPKKAERAKQLAPS